MSELVVGHHVTPEEVKAQTIMFVAMFTSMASWLPADNKMKATAEKIVAVANQEWFPGFMAYIINIFHDKPVTPENLKEALNTFGAKVDEQKDFKVKFDLQ